MEKLRVVFMGTAELSCDSLRGLLDPPDYEVVAVVTQPDRPKGRDLKLQPSPVKELATARNKPVLQPERARKPEFIASLSELRPDLIVVAAYGQILPPALLDLPRHGCVNVHTSLLPKYRGAAPIQWAIINGEGETGVTIMEMDEGMDTGAILTQERTPITPEDNSQTLHDRLAKMGADLLLRTLPDYVSGKLVPSPQDPALATYAPKITKEHGRIGWAQPAEALFNRLRGLVPWPGLYAFLTDGTGSKLLKIWEASPVDGSGAAGEVLSANKAGIVVACGQGALRITSLQREGGRRMTAQEFLAGHALTVGQKLG